MVFKTEYEFSLPRGYVDRDGTLHTKGVMRLATAADEILPMRDPRVQQNPGYLTVILLSRVISELGTLNNISTNIVERLYTADLAYLQEVYERINKLDNANFKVKCPNCQEEHELDMNFLDRGVY